MSIIDRRLSPKDKTIGNRQRVINRSRESVKRAVKEAIDHGKIADIESGRVRVKVKNMEEPIFRTDNKKGDRQYVLPGNKEHVVGDRQNKDNSGESRGKSGGLGEGEDDFEFLLSSEEFLNYIFDDLELPDLIKKQLKSINKTRPHRSGYTNTGNPSQLSVVKTMKNSIGRRIGLHRPSDDEIKILESKLAELLPTDPEYQELMIELEMLIKRQRSIAWIDPVDLRFRNFVQQPQPITAAVMFCILDCSGSMGQLEKDLAKRFFFFLSMFLRRKYAKVDIIFIRHHESAKEVDEEEFFHSKESGGTVVSSALELTQEIIQKRYNVSDWNIYISQVSDGDNFAADNDKTKIIIDQLLNFTQYYAYLEVRQEHFEMFNYTSDLWEMYTRLENEHENFSIRKAMTVSDVWKVFKELFSKENS